MKSALSFGEGMMAAHTVTRANEDMDGTVVESDSDADDYKPQLQSKSVHNPPSDMKSDVECSLADLDVVTNTDDEEIVYNGLTKGTNTLPLQIQILYAVE